MFDNGEEGYDEYPPEINRIIETARNSGAKYAEWPEKDDDGNKVTYEILFDEMVEIGSGDRVSVKRVKVGGEKTDVVVRRLMTTLTLTLLNLSYRVSQTSMACSCSNHLI